MPKTAKDYVYKGNYGYQRPYPHIVAPTRPKLKPIKPKKYQQKRTNPIAKFFSLIFMVLLGIYVIPFGFDRISKPLIFGSPYPEVKVNYNELLSPTVNYLSNDLFLGSRMLNGARKQKAQMTTLYMTQKMPALQMKLQQLMLNYKTIQPSVFVWDFDSGKYVDINGDKIFATASIIKIPVLIQLFRSIEANQMTIYDEMELTQYYVADGSGVLKTRRLGSRYTIDQLAKEMIQVSDNSATNMLVSKMGGMPDINQGIRSWGLKNTQINNWLPDLAGTNYTTAKDLATMLYNLDNPGFLNLTSREYIIDYMSHVENNRLIQAGLGVGATFVHKTGDIGKMLGDAGIVFAPNGKKYIIVILANRPYNSPLGKNFIQQASSLVYNTMISTGGY